MNWLYSANQARCMREDLCFPPLTIETSTARALMGDQVLPLTCNEFGILLLLAGQPETPFSLNEIYRHVWRMPDLKEVRTVRVHVSRLRQKLRTAFPDHEFIITVWAKGYAFVPKKD